MVIYASSIRQIWKVRNKNRFQAKSLSLHTILATNSELLLIKKSSRISKNVSKRLRLPRKRAKNNLKSLKSNLRNQSPPQVTFLQASSTKTLLTLHKLSQTTISTMKLKKVNGTMIMKLKIFTKMT